MTGRTRLDGEPDQRYSSSHGFGSDKQAASEEGKKGGSTQPEEIYKPKDHGGLKKDGTKDARTNPDHGFGGDREAAAKEGQKGGLTS